MYIEGGPRRRAAVETLKRATKVKPVVIIKSGRSSEGLWPRHRIQDQLAGSGRRFDDVIKQCGALRAEKHERMLLKLEQVSGQ